MSYSSQKFPLSMEIKLKTFYIPEIEKSVIHNPIDIIFHNPFCNHKTSLAAKKPDAIFCQKNGGWKNRKLYIYTHLVHKS